MDDIEILKRLAGVHEYKGKPVTENFSFTSTELKQRERALGIKPGDPEWFDLWFSLPGMTASNGFRGRRR
jgi:hypothetical protein